MNEDPLDQLCCMIVTMIVFVERMITLMLREAWISARYGCAIAWLQTRHVLVSMCLRAKSLWIGFYYRHVRIPLTLLGLVRPLTWADVEAMRLQASAKSGVDIPRPKELEDGLRREQGKA